MGTATKRRHARSIAEIHSILANGGVANGKRFLSEAGCRKTREQQTVVGSIEFPDRRMCRNSGFLPTATELENAIAQLLQSPVLLLTDMI